MKTQEELTRKIFEKNRNTLHSFTFQDCKSITDALWGDINSIQKENVVLKNKIDTINEIVENIQKVLKTEEYTEQEIKELINRLYYSSRR